MNNYKCDHDNTYIYVGKGDLIGLCYNCANIVYKFALINNNEYPGIQFDINMNVMHRDLKFNLNNVSIGTDIFFINKDEYITIFEQNEKIKKFIMIMCHKKNLVQSKNHIHILVKIPKMILIYIFKIF